MHYTWAGHIVVCYSSNRDYVYIWPFKLVIMPSHTSKPHSTVSPSPSSSWYNELGGMLHVDLPGTRRLSVSLHEYGVIDGIYWPANSVVKTNSNSNPTRKLPPGSFYVVMTQFQDNMSPCLHYHNIVRLSQWYDRPGSRSQEEETCRWLRIQWREVLLLSVTQHKFSVSSCAPIEAVCVCSNHIFRSPPLLILLPDYQSP